MTTIVTITLIAVAYIAGLTFRRRYIKLQRQLDADAKAIDDIYRDA